MNSLGKIPLWLTTIIAVAVFAAGIYLLIFLSPLFLGQLGISTNVGQPQEAPDFILEEVGGSPRGEAGGKVKLSDFRGQPVVLIFWTSWNESSLDALKFFGTYKAIRGGDLVVFAINSLEDQEVAQEAKDRYKIKLRMLLDTEGSAGESYKIGVLPRTIFIDKGGLIVSEPEGPLSIADIEERVAKLR